MRTSISVALLVASGCSHVAAAFIDTSGKTGRSVRQVDAPKVDRCRAQADADRRSVCSEVRDQVMTYVRRLAVEDQVCLEGNSLVDGVTHRCKVRAFVADAAPGRVKLEIREAPPSSKYVTMADYWFAEEALADLHLKSLGFAAPASP